MDDLLNQITGLTGRERKNILSWVASLAEKMVIEIFQDGVKKSFQLKIELPELPGRTIKYCAFILAARKAGWDSINSKGYRVAGREQYDDFSHLRSAKASELIRKGRTPLLRRKILAYWGEVRALKMEGLGFRPIADYLSKNRKVKTSASYLLKLWKEMEKID